MRIYKKNIFKVIKVLPQQLWTLEAVKNYLRISDNYDDDLILSLVYAAIGIAENFTNLNLIQKHIEFVTNIKNSKNFYLQYRPTLTLTAIYFIKDQIEHKIKEEEYNLNYSSSLLELATYLDNYELKLQYIAGFDDKNIPQPIKHGVLLHVAAMYDRQEQDSIHLSNEIRSLYSPYKHFRV